MKITDKQKEMLQKLRNGERVHWRKGRALINKQLATGGSKQCHSPLELTELGKIIEIDNRDQ